MTFNVEALRTSLRGQLDPYELAVGVLWGPVVTVVVLDRVGLAIRYLTGFQLTEGTPSDRLAEVDRYLTALRPQKIMSRPLNLTDPEPLEPLGWKVTVRKQGEAAEDIEVLSGMMNHCRFQMAYNRTVTHAFEHFDTDGEGHDWVLAIAHTARLFNTRS